MKAHKWSEIRRKGDRGREGDLECPIADTETARQRTAPPSRVSQDPESILGGKACQQSQSVGIGTPALVSLYLPFRLVNTANVREHWAKRAKRAKEQRCLTAMALGSEPPTPPLVIWITRIGPRRMDTDGLAISAKAVRDGVADWLRLDDGHDGLTWVYDQQKGKPKEYGVKVEVFRARS